MYPDVAPRIMPRMAKWMLREESILKATKKHKIHKVFLRLLCPFVALFLLKLVLLLGLCGVGLCFRFGRGFLFGDGFIALEAGRRSLLGGFDQLLCRFGVGSRRLHRQ